MDSQNVDILIIGGLEMKAVRESQRPRDEGGPRVPEA